MFAFGWPCTLYCAVQVGYLTKGARLLYIGKKRELTEYFKSVPLEKKQQLYRGVRSVVAILIKISKMTELYPITDKIFEEFTETMGQNLELIHNNLPYASVVTKKVGFYYQEKRVNLFDEGERKFRNIFLVNEIRELYFVKGVTKKELLDFFAVIKETINYTLVDYDFNTRLWDYGIVHIGTISDPDMGDPEPWKEEEFAGEQPAVTAQELLSMPPRKTADMYDIVREFDNIGKGRNSEFDEWLAKKGKAFTIQRYLERVRHMVLSGANQEAAKSSVSKTCEFALTNIQNGDFMSGVPFINMLVQLESEIKEAGSPLPGTIRTALAKISSDQFLNHVFEMASRADASQIKSFSECLAFASLTNFETVFLKLVELDSKEIRIPCLENIAENLKDVELVKRLAENSDWHVLRNLLFVLRFIYRIDYLPIARNVMNHQVRQVRVEAARVLSLYDADENIEYWRKAIFSPDEEVRTLAITNLVKVKGIVAKQTLNEIFNPANRDKFDLGEYERFIGHIVESNRPEFFDLPANLMFSESKELRRMALRGLGKVEDLTVIAPQIARRIQSEEFRSLEKQEIELVLGLAKGLLLPQVLRALEYIFKLDGGFFNRNKYAPFKKIVLDFMRSRAGKSPTIQKWLEKAMKEGDKEIRALLQGRA